MTTSDTKSSRGRPGSTDPGGRGRDGTPPDDSTLRLPASPPADPETHGLGERGGSLWAAVTDEYDLERHEELMLVEACRTVDLLESLASVANAEGPTLDGKVHPAVVEMRQQRIALARLLAALRLPAGDEADVQDGARRPQRRVGARGVYAIGGQA